jgi:serine/threonine-protein kinase
MTTVIREENDQLIELQEVNEPLELPDIPSSQSEWLPSRYQERIADQPQPIPGYLLIQQLGKGGMGEVQLGLSRQNGQVVAIKTILPKASTNSRDREMFLREAEVLENLRHDHIVRFHEVGDSNGLLYFVMEYVPGRDAKQSIKDEGQPFSVDRAIPITIQMLEALEYAHQLGFVHRDIKPANMLLYGEPGSEQMKLADFGLAKLYQSSKLSGLTMTKEIGGTPQFMPPEQITNFRQAGPAADQYSAAATLYYLLTSRTVFDFPEIKHPGDMANQLLMILNDKPIPLYVRNPELSDSLDLILQRALAKAPDARFANISEFKQALSAILR